jgi:two-component system cell cycle response regulator
VLVGSPGARLEGLQAGLARSGYDVACCAPRSSQSITADVRVLWAGGFESLPELVNEYGLDPRATLLVVESVAQETAALSFLLDADEVATIGAPLDGLVARLERVVRRTRALDEIRAQALKDPLTGLGNRKTLEAEAIRGKCNQNTDACRAVLLLDIDHFKSVNDSFGHVAGDMVLVEIARRISAAAARDDYVCRCGGEEFAVLISRATEREAVVAAQVMRSSAALRPIPLAASKCGEVTVTLSGGVGFLNGAASFAECLQQADSALYAAKAAGRDRLVTYDGLLEAAVAGEQDVEVLHFQNVTKVVTERVTNLITLFGKGLLEEAQRQAKTDTLTTLRNRRYFDERIAREVDLARKDGRQLSLAMLDLDHFGRFNKTFDEPTGDTVLRKFAEVAARSIRSIDWLARYGGEEFCLVVPGDARDAMTIAERIRANLAATTIDTDDNGPQQVTVSIGVAQFTCNLESATDFVRKASAALREAKRLGRNQVHLKA